jgi:hypothetical protein
MATNTVMCSHFNEIIDERNGDIICTDCGLCLDVVFDNYYEKNFTTDENFDSLTKKQLTIKEYICDLLERLHVSQSWKYDIENLYIQRRKNFPPTKKFQLLTYLCYEVLNNNNISVSIKDIAQRSEFSVEEIYDMQQNGQSIILNLEEILEKYCTLLNLSYYDYSVIKKNLPTKQTGHNPLTIVGSLIFAFADNNNLNLKLEQISNCIGISKISIQRYYKKYKNVLS